MSLEPMTFDEFYNLTAGQRIARRGTTAPRTFHVDWALSQMTEICDFAVANPWLRHTLGRNMKASVQASTDGETVAFIFTKVAP